MIYFIIGVIVYLIVGFLYMKYIRYDFNLNNIECFMVTDFEKGLILLGWPIDLVMLVLLYLFESTIKAIEWIGSKL